MRRSATAVAFDVVGSAAVLVLLALTWQTARVSRSAPFADIVAGLSGRTLQPAAFALALVALAGAVAALATRGWARRVVGVAVVACGVVLVVVSLSGLRASGDARARSLVAQAVADRSGGGVVVPLTTGDVTVSTHAVWPVLTAVASLLLVLAGVVWALDTSARAQGLANRYEAPVAAERPRDATLWSALDHGEDPTVVPDDAHDDPRGDDEGNVSDRNRIRTEPDLDASPDLRTS